MGPRSYKISPRELTNTGDVINSLPPHPTGDKAGQPPTTVYRRRWYILAVYSLVSFTQAGVWNTWGPIAVSVEKAFGWDHTILALLPNWGPIGFLMAAWITSWSMDVQGLRMSCSVVSVLVAVATAIRCITSEPPYITWTANIAAFLNGLGGPVAMGAPPVLSAAWFPPHQRTTATAIATLCNYGGLAASFLISPLFDENSQEEILNTTSTAMFTLLGTSTQNTSSPTVSSDDVEITAIRHKVMLVLYAEAGWCAMVMILVLAYFPSKPPTPPSNTASEERLDIKSGFKKLLRNKMFMMLCMSYGLPLGILGLWSSVLDVNLQSYDVSQADAGWIGFYSIVAGCVGALIMARVSDLFSKHIKQLLIFLYTMAFASFLWFNLILSGVIPSSIGDIMTGATCGAGYVHSSGTPDLTFGFCEAQIYSSVIVGTLLTNATVPLLFEMACENTYPIAEGITTIVMTTWLNIVGLVFLGVQMIPGVGTAWENWSILASIGVCIPVLCIMNDSYNRLTIDENTKDRDYSE